MIKIYVNELCDVSIYDIRGKLVYFSNINKGTQGIDLSILENGVYIITCKGKNGVGTRKIVKK